VRCIPIVDERENPVGVVSQAEILLEGDNARKAEETVQQISRPYGKHSE